MKNKISNWLKIRYPQNYIIRYPVRGAIIIAVFTFGFTLIYKPLNTQAARTWTYAMTVIVYSILSSASVIPAVLIIKSFNRLTDTKEWTILKELLADVFVLLFTGIIVYFLGFIVETTGPRWNIETFINSVTIGSLLGIIPIAFFTGINYRYLFSPETIPPAGAAKENQENMKPETLIEITSTLKKEELSFYPSEFLYAESDGNYVDFYLYKDNLVRKEVIRNSINNIEQQLSGIPWFLRTHRAFIINLRKVKSKQGNSLGYLIKLGETETKIPVSRQNTGNFNRLLKKFAR